MDQRDRFDRIIGLLNGAVLDDALWPRASRLIDEACGSRGNVLYFGKARSNAPAEIYLARACFRGEERAEQTREYLSHYHPVDEHVPRMHKLPDGKIVSVAEVFTEEERKKSRVYNEAYPRFEIQNALEARLDMPGGSHIAWGMADPMDSHGWTTPRVDMISRLLPHVRQYVLVRDALAGANALGATAMRLLDNTRVGILQLDRRGSVMDMNDRAARLIRENHGLSCRANSLVAAGPGEQSRLDELLARALPRYGEPGRSGSMTVRRSSPLPALALHVAPVEGGEERHGTARVAALTLLVDPMDRAGIDAALVRELLGLTPREARIAAMLAGGRTLHQVAAKTGRSYGTLRSQLNQIFAKLGVSRQLELVRTVLELAKIPPSKD